MKFLSRWQWPRNNNNTVTDDSKIEVPSRFQQRLSGLAYKIKPWLPPVNFITIHYTYYILISLFASLIFWGCSNPSGSIGYWDSLFLTVSAFTSAGLNSVNISSMSTGQQVILSILLILGNPILISIFTLAFRKHIFEKRFKDIVQAENARMKTTGAVVGMAGAMFGLPVMSTFRSFSKSEAKLRQNSQSASPHIMGGMGSRLPTTTTTTVSSISPNLHGHESTAASNHTTDLEAGKSPFLTVPATVNSPRMALSPGARSITFLDPIQEPPSQATGLGVSNALPRAGTSHHRASPNMARQKSGFSTGTDTAQRPTVPGFNIQSFVQENKAQIGRNGQFFNLTAEEREYLGGVEYRALKLLIATVTTYFVAFQVFGAIALGAWIAVNDPYVTRENSQNPWWTGIFLSISAFNNGGVCLLDAGIAAFSASYFTLIVVIILMLTGSAAFPVFLRLTLWTMAQVLKYGTDEEDFVIMKETLEFTLKYPRRVYTMLFPSRPTWYLVMMLVGLVAVDWVLILVLSLGNAILTSLPVGQRVFDVLFQSISIWSGGFSIISPSSVYIDLQLLWMIVMYLETYPQTITMRNSNVYEERSLGIYAGEDTGDYEVDEKSSSMKAGGLDSHVAAQTLLSVPPRSNNANLLFSPTSAKSQASRFSQRSIRHISAVGRRSTAFVGRQIQQRMGGFQGVGVSAPRKSSRMHTGKSSSTFFHTHPAGSPSLSVSSTDTFRSLHTKHEAKVDLVSQQVRSQLSHDVWWMAFALFVIVLIETKHSLMDPNTYNVFSILFEVVSAYTNIGLSMGLPNVAYSLSGGLYTGSKIVMVLVMLRGRHRGLPVALDRAVRLPKERLDDEEEEDAQIKRTLSQEAGGLRSRMVSRSASYEVPPP